MGRSRVVADSDRDPTGHALLEQWAREFRLPLIKFFQRRGPATAEPDDLVQEVFLRLAKRSDLAAIERIEGYLFQTAASVLVDRHRKDQRQPEIVESLGEAAHGVEVLTPERVLMDRQSLDRLVQGLFALPKRTRHIFALYHFENMRQTDIAARFHMPISTVEKHMARANKQLLKSLRRCR